MPLNAEDLSAVAARLVQLHTAERMRLDPIHDAVRGAVQDIYVPRSATMEYRHLVDQSRFNVLRLVVNSLAQSLYVDGYRAGGSEENSPVWDQVWQPNRMDARQAGLYRSSIQYGCSYALALPDRRDNAPSPVSITPYSPRQITVTYEHPALDEWPQYAAVWGRKTSQGTEVWLYDDQQAYGLLVGEGSQSATIRTDAQGQRLVREHGLGVTPVVRFPDSWDDLDDGPLGKVEPLLPVQRQINQTTFSLLMAQHYAAFRQRWATGMAIAEDENGAPIEPWNAAVNRVWQNDSPDGKFGDFEATDLRPYLDSRDKALLYVSNVAQIPPHHLVVGNGISNISAEALAALEAAHRQDIVEHQNVLGESVEQMLRLAGLAMGDRQAWEDRSAEVIWRDTTPRSLAQLFDAWGKGVQMLGVPAQGAWEHLPVSDQERQRWRAMAQERDAIAALDRLVNGSTGAEPSGAPADAGAPR